MDSLEFLLLVMEMANIQQCILTQLVIANDSAVLESQAECVCRAATSGNTSVFETEL